MDSKRVSYRVYYEDTDAAGVVYHANYLKFAERARSEWLRSSGVEQSKLMVEEGIFFVVYHLEIEFLAPAVLDDLLDLEIEVVEVKHVTLKLRQTILCKGKTIAILHVSLASLNREKKPTRWPELRCLKSL